MSGKFEFSSESAFADLTVEWLYPEVYLLMPDKIRRRCKFPLAHITCVRLLAGVLPPVLVEISRVIELLLTELAH